MSATSLRERSRERRRAAISHAALTLFAAGGYDATTVADIAEVAEVSTRTVSLYFPAKLDLALVYTTDAAHRFADIITAAAGTEPLADLCTQWVQEEFRAHREMLGLHRAMLEANPALRGTQSRDVSSAKATIGRALASELGRPIDDPIVALVGAVIDGALSALLQLPPEEVQASGATLSTRRLIRMVIQAADDGDLDN